MYKRISLEFNDILENLIAGVCTAILFAFITFLYSYFRNKKLVNKLEKSVLTDGIGITYDKDKNIANFNIQLFNYSKVDIRIRDVMLLAGEKQGYITMVFDDKCGLSQNPLINKMLIDDFSEITLNKSFQSENTIPNVITLPSHTSGVWELKDKNVIDEKKNWDIRNLYIIVEYPTLFGNTSLIRIEANERILKTIRESFSRICKTMEIKNTSLFSHQQPKGVSKRL